ncbi:hypothetical protein X777_16908 [Ooceraea biroi]|uniref:Uncharacterized protein n=1 Tax=Ooceraea biroi TaxID=2015173 RepID=A0A026WV19_OOCBI|nr:hypothetical protein X777_16908 [Ooceraea biroi]
MAYDKCNLELDSSIGASSIPARVNIGRTSMRPDPKSVQQPLDSTIIVEFFRAITSRSRPPTIHHRATFAKEKSRRGSGAEEAGREVLNSSVRIVDKIYEAGGYGLSGPCTTESGHRLDSGSPFWKIHLDQDLLDTISAIYPEWFKDYTNSRAASTSSTSSSASGVQSCNENAAVVVVTERSGEHKIAKGDAKSKSKAKKADSHKDKDRNRKDPRRDVKDERDAGNGKKGTRSTPQQDKAAADAAGRKAAGAVPGSGTEMAEGNQSPPKAEVDDSPLQHAMDRNKESRAQSGEEEKDEVEEVKEEEEVEEEDEDEREGSLEPKNSGDRVLTLATAARNRFSLTMPTHSELNGTSSLSSASDRARRRLNSIVRQHTSVNTTHSSQFLRVCHLFN